MQYIRIYINEHIYVMDMFIFFQFYLASNKEKFILFYLRSIEEAVINN